MAEPTVPLTLGAIEMGSNFSSGEFLREGGLAVADSRRPCSTLRTEPAANLHLLLQLLGRPASIQDHCRFSRVRYGRTLSPALNAHAGRSLFESINLALVWAYLYGRSVDHKYAFSLTSQLDISVTRFGDLYLGVPWQLTVVLTSHGIVGTIVQVQCCGNSPSSMHADAGLSGILRLPPICCVSEHLGRHSRLVPQLPALRLLGMVTITLPRDCIGSRQTLDGDLSLVQPRGRSHVQSALQLGHLPLSEPQHCREWFFIVDAVVSLMNCVTGRHL
jgi:hypothetical protein